MRREMGPWHSWTEDGGSIKERSAQQMVRIEDARYTEHVQGTNRRINGPMKVREYCSRHVSSKIKQFRPTSRSRNGPIILNTHNTFEHTADMHMKN